jgi:hypothetical protein
MSTRTTCPYCNSVTNVPAGAAGGQRLICDRCGDPFVYRPSEDPAPGQPEGRAGVAAPPPVPRTRRWSNRTIGVALVAAMLVIAGGTLAFALLTQDFRRNIDTRGAEPEVPRGVLPVPPRSLAGLGYLPRGTNFVAALHVAEAMHDPAGREFLTRFQAGDFVPLPPKAAEHVAVAKLPQLTGLSLDELDHVVVGANLDRAELIPGLTVVVQTREPYDQEKIKSALKAQHSPRPERELYEVQVEKSLSGVLWFAANKTLVLGLFTVNLDGVPATPWSGLGHLAPAVREVLEDRMGPAAQAWLVGHSDDWTKTTPGLLLLPRLAEGTRSAVEKVRTVGVWLTFGEGLTLGGTAECADAESAAALERFLVPVEDDRKPIRLFGDRPQWAAVARQLGETLKSVRKDTWLMIQARAKAETVRQALEPSGPSPR